jgi:predicted CXXCH cytochrome family protein
MCTSCHLPHKSANEKLLVSNEPELCFQCHEKERIVVGDFVHSPVASGACSACHPAHSSQSGNLLKNFMPDLCNKCHVGIGSDGNRHHGPFKIGMCGSCHEPHRSNKRTLLILSIPELCFSCHSKKSFSGANVHIPVAENNCLLCHGTHTSNFSHMMKHKGDKVCKSCHERIFMYPHPKTGFLGEIKENPKESLRYRLFGDAPPNMEHPRKGRDTKRGKRRFGCISCHSPHSSDWIDLFRYEASTPEELCSACH